MGKRELVRETTLSWGRRDGFPERSLIELRKQHDHATQEIEVRVCRAAGTTIPWWEGIVNFVIAMNRNAKLLQIVFALGTACSLACVLNRREK